MDLKLKQLYGETRPTWDTKASLAMKIVKKIWTQPKQQSIQRSNSSLTLPTFGVNIRKVYLQVRTDLINFKELKDKELNQKIKADWIVPKNLPNGTKRERVLVYFHGGGYCFGSRKVHRPLAVTLLKSLEGTKLIIPDYGLAPEEPFPIGLLHCLSTYLNLINPVDTSAPYHPDDIFIVGDSAGAGLALSCMLWLRDNTNFPQPKGYIVMSPWIDQTVSHPSFILNRSFDYITGSVGNEETVRDQTWLNDERSMYYATHDSLLTYPLVSPVFAKNRLSDSVKLPPILLQSGDCELLRDEIITFFCKTLPNAPIRYENYADSVHDFQFIPFQRLSKTALHSCLNFIQDVLNDTFIPRKSYFVEKPKGKSAIFKEFLNPYEIVLEGQRVIASLTEEGILDLWNAMKPKIKKGLIGELEEDLKEAENDASFSFDGEKFNKSEILLNSNDSGMF
ncbi:hypothetical protein HK099_000378 [Clydaea vesicula]|uniref:Alpha/beta hydrolase fold-3 domain-containing protein n=1 Tax=Clydaea vesicula TaxID=447962 RepID=A0AAD5U4I8_9FUNG|nr:hypothetical protein HK099_000378 [Clydaea vesicula]